MLHDLGIDVEVWFGSCKDELLTLFNKEGISYVNLEEKRGVFNNKLDKVNNWIDFRYSVIKQLKSIKNVNDVFLWFGTVESLIPLVGKLNQYSYGFTSLELLDDNFFKRNMLRFFTKSSSFIVCCESTRAYIMRYWYNLNSLPYIMPNKPYKFNPKRKITPSIQKTQHAMEIIKDKKIIIYQGILKSKDYMLEMAKAINESKGDFYFLLMGQDPENIFPSIQNVCERAIFIENIPAPYHLEITSYATIGFVFYDDRNTLNRAFCAPNKIYEYSGFGIPAIGNEVPGLLNTVGAAKAGVFVPLKKEYLIRAINDININYDDFKNNALKFFDNTDNIKTMKDIIKKHILSEG